jgi:hypothetical protein
LTAVLAVTYFLSSVVASSAKKVLLALLVQAVLIGHAVCICGSVAKFEAGASDTAGCPLHRAATPSGGAEPTSPHDADSSCPHCGTQAVLSAAGPDAPPAAVSLYVGAAVASNASALSPSLAHTHAAWLARVGQVPVSPAPLTQSGVLQI